MAADFLVAGVRARHHAKLRRRTNQKSLIASHWELPIFVRIKTNLMEYRGLLTQAHLRECSRIGADRPRNLSVFVNAAAVPAKRQLPLLNCVLPDGSPILGAAAQPRTVGGAGLGSPMDATLLSVSDRLGRLDLGLLWCSGRIEYEGLMLHAPGYVPVIVTPDQLASAAGGELKVVFKHRELVVKAQCRLTPEQIKRANQPGNFDAPQDVIPIGAPDDLDLTALGKLFEAAFPLPATELAIARGWDFAPLEALVGRKAASADVDEFDPLELLSWYRNQREYDTASGEWTFVLPCHGCYAVPLAVDYDSKGNLRPPLALVIDAREGRTPTITLLAD